MLDAKTADDEVLAARTYTLSILETRPDNVTIPVVLADPSGPVDMDLEPDEYGPRTGAEGITLGSLTEDEDDWLFDDQAPRNATLFGEARALTGDGDRQRVRALCPPVVPGGSVYACVAQVQDEHGSWGECPGRWSLHDPYIPVIAPNGDQFVSTELQPDGLEAGFTALGEPVLLGGVSRSDTATVQIHYAAGGGARLAEVSFTAACGSSSGSVAVRTAVLSVEIDGTELDDGQMSAFAVDNRRYGYSVLEQPPVHGDPVYALIGDTGPRDEGGPAYDAAHRSPMEAWAVVTLGAPDSAPDDWHERVTADFGQVMLTDRATTSSVIGGEVAPEYELVLLDYGGRPHLPAVDSPDPAWPAYYGTEDYDVDYDPANRTVSIAMETSDSPRLTTKLRLYEATEHYLVDSEVAFETSVVLRMRGNEEHEPVLRVGDVVTRGATHHWRVRMEGQLGPDPDFSFAALSAVAVDAAADGTPWHAGFPGRDDPVWAVGPRTYDAWTRVTDGSPYRRYYLGPSADLIDVGTQDRFID